MNTAIAAGLSWLAIVSYAQTPPATALPASTVTDTLPAIRLQTLPIAGPSVITDEVPKRSVAGMQVADKNELGYNLSESDSHFFRVTFLNQT